MRKFTARVERTVYRTTEVEGVVASVEASSLSNESITFLAPAEMYRVGMTVYVTVATSE